MASSPLAEGNLSIAFYETNPANTLVENDQTYIVNLGAASLFRENTRSGVSVSTVNPALASSNIGADLEAVFGSDWAETGTVRWMVVGTVSASSPTILGDPARTIYFSRRRASLSSGQTGAGSTIQSINSSRRGFLTTDLSSFTAGTNAAINFTSPNMSTSGINLAGVVIPTTNQEVTIDKVVPPATTGLYFGVSIDPTQVLSSGVISGGAGVEGALDMYRVLDEITNDTDLTAGASTGNAVVGAGQFIGTLTIDAAGNLKIKAVGAAPSGDSDADGMADTWETTFFGNLAQTATGDFDADGSDNLTEFRLGLIPNSGSSRFAVVRSTTGTLTWPSVTGVSFRVERSTTLAANSWQQVGGTVTGTAGTASFSDPTPPAGSAFYRVALQP